MAGSGRDISTCTSCGGLLYWDFDHWVHQDTNTDECPDYDDVTLNEWPISP